MQPSERWKVFYRVVRAIPRGRVSTYGEVAMLAGAPGYARHVGHALAALRGSRHSIPWQRVLAKDGARRARIAILDAVGAAAQRDLLSREGVAVGEDGRVDLDAFGWRRSGRERPTPRAPGERPRSRRRTRGSSGRS
ncbi:MAG TPA: MGMT family protein [Anaeromyxobacteraceae bacterium]|nr:MGMT family protein [Anaeromyxobacteraceae bacterium]